MSNENDSEDDLRRIRRTWAMASAGGDVVATLFYNRLFEISPEARGMFQDDMGEQGRKLMQTLNWIVDHVDAPETLRPRAEALAVRHVHYGVDPGHYPAVGQALIDTLNTGLGDAFTDEDAAAWGRVYGVLSGIMIDAAYPAQASD